MAVVNITNVRHARWVHWQLDCPLISDERQQELQEPHQELQEEEAMFARTLFVAGGLVLALAGAAAAQTVVTGTVTRVDEAAAVIVLQDG